MRTEGEPSADDDDVDEAVEVEIDELSRQGSVLLVEGRKPDRGRRRKRPGTVAEQYRQVARMRVDHDEVELAVAVDVAAVTQTGLVPTL